jgi:uncharacterized protein YjaG (DUF416 family)
MAKGLKELEKIKDIRFTETVADIGGYSLRTVEIGKDYKKECTVIEKELKALEIISQVLDIKVLINQLEKKGYPKEKIDLLKEVLNYGK